MDQHFIELQDGRQKVFLTFREVPDNIPAKVQSTVQKLMRVRNGAEVVDVAYQVGSLADHLGDKERYHVYLTVTTQAKA
ncbi:hypothetical protein [Deinococcus sp. Marseille-Q6407]|uniref:hypothetical protein n=1 Tax=Deinococcus sp. Marseille-Q6407 TaxID=2969223 RepID=UPI0021BF1BE5|nr:hypothetical protein [Deinococcus sp. Marseille-Q6407]